MPRQFSPDDRERVKEVIESHDHVLDAIPCGNGLRVELQRVGEFFGTTEAMEQAGWYAAGVHWEDRCIIFMPVTEVPE